MERCLTPYTLRMRNAALLALLFSLVLGAQLPRVAAQSVDCSVAAIQAKSPSGTTITGATIVPADGTRPQYCRVDGHAASPGNEVNFRLGLPDGWNGKFLFQGVGGLGGTIANLDSSLARGYASASTDTGHIASDPNWGANRAKEIDYGYRGTHVTAVASKAIAAAFYAKPVQYAYFNGCSNGGRQAMMEVQRYPGDFDGVIAGDPATGTPMQVGRAVFFQQLLASPANYLPVDKVELLSRSTLAACDGNDGLVDGLISDPRSCTFDPARLATPARQVHGCWLVVFPIVLTPYAKSSCLPWRLQVVCLPRRKKVIHELFRLDRPAAQRPGWRVVAVSRGCRVVADFWHHAHRQLCARLFLHAGDLHHLHAGRSHGQLDKWQPWFLACLGSGGCGCWLDRRAD